MRNLSSIRTVSVLGIPVAACSHDAAVSTILDMAAKTDRAYGVTFADASNITRGRHDPSFGAVLRSLDGVMPDGMPVLWGVNRQLSSSNRLKKRVSGPDVFKRFQDDPSIQQGLKHFYLGGSEELLGELIRIAEENCSKLNVVGSYSPPFGDWNEEVRSRMIERIRAANANVIWVGLGCPKQERWIAQNLSILPPGVYLGVGAAFAFYTGNVKRAPLWMQKCGIEWLHRLLSEPRRLWKRYFVYNTLFIYYSVVDYFKRSS